MKIFIVIKEEIKNSVLNYGDLIDMGILNFEENQEWLTIDFFNGAPSDFIEWNQVKDYYDMFTKPEFTELYPEIMI
jgi:hypothetical protein